MQVDFVLKNTHATGNDIREFLTEKTGKLERYMSGESHAKWVITYENEEHISHLHVTSKDVDYFGEARQHNLLSSIEEAVDHVERQLKKHKEIMKDHR